MRIVMIGGVGLLGSALATRLGRNPQGSMLIIDKQTPAVPCRGNVALDAHDSRALASHLRSGDVVIHLAALHGFHLDAGATAEECWRANFQLTKSVARACVSRAVHRLVFASSTSVYGSGSSTGLAQILDEMTPVAPEDVYEYGKVAAEGVVTATGARLKGGAVCLRLGRFRFDDEEAREISKLSTGLDIADAVSAVCTVAVAERIASPIYVVASDTQLPPRWRRELGCHLDDTVQRFMPSLHHLSQLGHVRLPKRIRKSASSELLRRDLGWRPTQTVEAWARRKLAHLAMTIDESLKEQTA